MKFLDVQDLIDSFPNVCWDSCCKWTGLSEKLHKSWDRLSYILFLATPSIMLVRCDAYCFVVFDIDDRYQIKQRDVQDIAIVLVPFLFRHVVRSFGKVEILVLIPWGSRVFLQAIKYDSLVTHVAWYACLLFETQPVRNHYDFGSQY